MVNWIVILEGPVCDAVSLYWELFLTHLICVNVVKIRAVSLDRISFELDVLNKLPTVHIEVDQSKNTMEKSSGSSVLMNQQVGFSGIWVIVINWLPLNTNVTCKALMEQKWAFQL